MMFCARQHHLTDRSFCSKRKRPRPLQDTRSLAHPRSPHSPSSLPSCAMAQTTRSLPRKGHAEDDRLWSSKRAAHHTSSQTNLRKIQTRQAHQNENSETRYFPSITDSRANTLRRLWAIQDLLHRRSEIFRYLYRRFL